MCVQFSVRLPKQHPSKVVNWTRPNLNRNRHILIRGFVQIRPFEKQERVLIKRAGNGNARTENIKTKSGSRGATAASSARAEKGYARKSVNKWCITESEVFSNLLFSSNKTILPSFHGVASLFSFRAFKGGSFPYDGNNRNYVVGRIWYFYGSDRDSIDSSPFWQQSR